MATKVFKPAGKFGSAVKLEDRQTRSAADPTPKVIAVAGSGGTAKDKIRINGAAAIRMQIGNRSYVNIASTRDQVNEYIYGKDQELKQQYIDWCADATENDFGKSLDITRWMDDNENLEVRVENCPIKFYVFSALPRKDSAGAILKSRDTRLTLDEIRELCIEKGVEEKADLEPTDFPEVVVFDGFKVSAPGFEKGKIGLDMEGNDSKLWRHMGGNDELHIIYKLKEGVAGSTIGLDEVETVYPITYFGVDKKAEKGTKE